MIGWGPQTYAPLHDHPIGGCLAKVVTGPGVVETHYWKPNNILNQRGCRHILRHSTRVLIV